MEDQGVVLSGKNFRSAYYESLGFKGKEKQISQLDKQLKEETIDIDRLKIFCLKNTLPALYRPLVWKLLLNAESHHQDTETRQFIISQKLEQFHDLKHAVLTISSSSSSSGLTCRLNPTEVLVYMYGIEKGRLNEIKKDVTLRRSLIMLAKPFMDWFENEVDAYYCFLGFTAIMDTIMKNSKTMIEDLNSYLMQKENVLYRHLLTLNVLHEIPCKKWFHEAFINDLPITDIEIVWDKLIGGSYTILVYIAINLILHRKRSLLMSKNADQALKLFENLNEEDTSLILKQGLELWESNFNGTSLIQTTATVT